jgi:hypothetical protein
MLGQLPKRPSGAGYEQTFPHFEVKHRTQTWPLRIAHLPGVPQPECSYTQRAKSFDSGGRKKLLPSGIAWFWPSSRLLATCPVSLLGRAGKDVRKTKNPPAESNRSGIRKSSFASYPHLGGQSESNELEPRSTIAVTFARPVHLIIRRAIRIG